MTTNWLVPESIVEGEAASSFTSQRANLANHNSMRQSPGEWQPEGLQNLDWVDRYALVRHWGNRDPGFASEVARHVDFAEVPNEAIAVNLASNLLQVAKSSRAVENSTKAVSFLADNDRVKRMSAGQAFSLLTTLGLVDLESTERLLQSLKELNHPVMTSIGTRQTISLLTARLLVAKGTSSEAYTLLQQALQTPVFQVLDRYRPKQFVGLRLQLGLIGLEAGEDLKQLLESFRVHIESPDPELAFAPKFLAYAAGVPLEIKPDFEDVFVSGNEKAIRFLTTVLARERRDWNAAIRAVELLVQVSDSTYVYRVALDTFPFTQGHARLMQAEILFESGDAAQARQAFDSAMADWESFKRSAREQKIDERSLWNYRISFDSMRKRIGQLITKPAP
jgi:hypothetical protein